MFSPVVPRLFETAACAGTISTAHFESVACLFLSLEWRFNVRSRRRSGPKRPRATRSLLRPNSIRKLGSRTCWREITHQAHSRNLVPYLVSSERHSRCLSAVSHRPATARPWSPSVGDEPTCALSFPAKCILCSELISFRFRPDHACMRRLALRLLRYNSVHRNVHGLCWCEVL